MKIFAAFVLLFSLSGIIGCSSNVIKTELALNKLHFQDGETLGVHHTSFGLSGSEGQLIRTTITKELNETVPDTAAEYDVATRQAKRFILTPFLQQGLSENLDVLMELSAFFGHVSANAMTLTSVGWQVFFKYRFIQNHPAFAASLMPGIGYTKGFESSSGNLSASSGSFKLDLNLPMSYRFNRNLAVHFGLCLSSVHYSGKCDDRMADIRRVSEFKKNYLVPGVTFGATVAVFRPEIRIDYDDEKLISYFGMQFRLK